MQTQRTARTVVPELWLVEDRGHDTPCWIWQAAKTTAGYAESFLHGRVVYVHRVIYEQHCGPIPDGLFIDHLCRQSSCVNPAHLEPVTNAVNVQRGKKAKLNPDLVIEIRARSARGEGYRTLGHSYGVDRTTIRNIVKRRAWRNI